MPKVHIPQPKNVRKINGSFAWVDHRLLQEGYLAVMTHQDQMLYLFLILAADRNGVSFYRKEKICDILSLDFQQFEIARDRRSDVFRSIDVRHLVAVSGFDFGRCVWVSCEGDRPLFSGRRRAAQVDGSRRCSRVDCH